MLDRLIDLIIEFLSFFQFVFIVDEYEGAVVLRLGRYHRTKGPGAWLMIPFNVERVIKQQVAVDTKSLGVQSLTTSDGVAVAIGTVVTFKVNDVKKFLLEVEKAETVLQDSTFGTMAKYVKETSWEDLHKAAFLSKVRTTVRSKAQDWGIDVMSVQLSDIARAKTLRLMQATSNTYAD